MYLFFNFELLLDVVFIVCEMMDISITITFKLIGIDFFQIFIDGVKFFEPILTIDEVVLHHFLFY